jgi:hypothetical protein
MYLYLYLSGGLCKTGLSISVIEVVRVRGYNLVCGSRRIIFILLPICLLPIPPSYAPLPPSSMQGMYSFLLQVCKTCVDNLGCNDARVKIRDMPDLQMNPQTY